MLQYCKTWGDYLAIFTPIEAGRILAGIGGVDIGIVWHERNYHKSGKGKRTIVKHGNLVQSFMVARITNNHLLLDDQIY